MAITKDDGVYLDSYETSFVKQLKMYLQRRDGNLSKNCQACVTSFVIGECKYFSAFMSKGKHFHLRTLVHKSLLDFIVIKQTWQL